MLDAEPYGTDVQAKEWKATGVQTSAHPTTPIDPGHSHRTPLVQSSGHYGLEKMVSSKDNKTN